MAKLLHILDLLSCDVHTFYIVLFSDYLIDVIKYIATFRGYTCCKQNKKRDLDSIHLCVTTKTLKANLYRVCLILLHFTETIIAA